MSGSNHTVFIGKEVGIGVGNGDGLGEEVGVEVGFWVIVTDGMGVNDGIEVIVYDAIDNTGLDEVVGGINCIINTIATATKIRMSNSE
jgi:hypothetical protein